MHVPVEIVAQVIGYIQMDISIEELLVLRLVSGMFNMEVLRVLPNSDQMHPRNTDKLLELGRVPFGLRKTSEHFSRYKKRQMPAAALLSRKRPSDFHISGGEYYDNDHQDDGDKASNMTATEVARPLAPTLLKPYLVARMEDTDTRPCLLSTLIERSVDVVLEHKAECTASERERIFMDMVAAFNAELVGHCFAEDIFSALFDSHGLRYWLPLYDAVSLTVYPDAEHTLRLFHLFRRARRSAQLRDCDEGASQQNTIINLLASLPTTPKYARLFVIDAFNLVMSSKNEHVLDAFLASETGKLLGSLTISERIWCAAKQGKGELTVLSLTKAVVSHGLNIRDNRKMIQTAILVIQGLIESGQETHLGRTVVDQLVQCKNVREIIELCRDMDLEDCTEIWHRANAADLHIWR